jgi:hypothetical protein
MTDPDTLRRAAETLRDKANAATPGPWREGRDPTGRNTYAALVADSPHPDRTNPDKGGWGYDEGYGGCLIGESLMAADRRYIATMHPGVALALADWLTWEADLSSVRPPGMGWMYGREVARAILGETP